MVTYDKICNFIEFEMSTEVVTLSLTTYFPTPIRLKDEEGYSASYYNTTPFTLAYPYNYRMYLLGDSYNPLFDPEKDLDKRCWIFNLKVAENLQNQMPYDLVLAADYLRRFEASGVYNTRLSSLLANNIYLTPITQSPITTANSFFLRFSDFGPELDVAIPNYTCNSSKSASSTHTHLSFFHGEYDGYSRYHHDAAYKSPKLLSGHLALFKPEYIEQNRCLPKMLLQLDILRKGSRFNQNTLYELFKLQEIGVLFVCPDNELTFCRVIETYPGGDFQLQFF